MCEHPITHICVCAHAKTNICEFCGLGLDLDWSIDFTFHVLLRAVLLLQLYIPTAFNIWCSFYLYQVLSKYLVRIEEKKIHLLSWFQGTPWAQNKSYNVLFTSVRGQICDYMPTKHSLRWWHTEAPQAALMSVGSRSLSAAFPALCQNEWCSAGLVIFILATVLCYLTGMSLITQWPKPLNWNVLCAVGEITDAFLSRLEQSHA